MFSSDRGCQVLFPVNVCLASSHEAARKLPWAHDPSKLSTFEVVTGLCPTKVRSSHNFLSMGKITNVNERSSEWKIFWTHCIFPNKLVIFKQGFILFCLYFFFFGEVHQVAAKHRPHALGAVDSFCIYASASYLIYLIHPLCVHIIDFSRLNALCICVLPVPHTLRTTSLYRSVLRCLGRIFSWSWLRVPHWIPVFPWPVTPSWPVVSVFFPVPAPQVLNT